MLNTAWKYSYKILELNTSDQNEERLFLGGTIIG